jgi:hypothetical protein
MKRLLGVMVVLVAVGLVLMPTNAQAGDKFGMKNEIEVGGSIAFQSVTPVVAGTTGDATTMSSIAPYVGYFFVDGFELGLAPMINITSPPGGSTTTDMTIFLAPAYNFQLQNSVVTPFFEGLLGVSKTTVGGNSASGLSFGARAGAKVNVTGNALLNFDVRYLLITAKPSGVPDRYGSNILEIAVGFTVWFN